jgi:hypothetical protein
VNSIGTLVVVAALAICIYGVVQIQSKDRQMRPRYQDLLSQPVLFRGGVPVKIRFASNWGTKTLALMDLVVTTSGVCIVNRYPSLGRILGAQWYARSTDIQARLTPIVRVPGSRGSVWIALSCSAPDNHFEVAVLPRGELSEILEALREAGADVQAS